MKKILIIIFMFLIVKLYAQPVPAVEENIPFLVTFSKDAPTSYGDDDYVQIFFFSIPKDYKKPFYIRIFDPDLGGKYDEKNSSSGTFNSKTQFSFYGGNDCISNEDAIAINPIGNYKSGNLINTYTFGVDKTLDDTWFTMGPFNPAEGEYKPQYYGNVFKLIAEGLSGDDGNLYKYYLSSSANENIPIPGGNAFTFEYTFRLPSNTKDISHIYPFIDDKVVSIKQTNFDWDKGGVIKLFSISTYAKELKISGENEFAESIYYIKTSEKGTSLDLQFHITSKKPLTNNNVVFSITNQYGKSLPFYTVPIGGVPKYKGKIKIKPLK